jgi:hypothetical protein
MPPTPVSGAPRTSHDAAHTPGIKPDHRSRSIRTSYIEAGVAVDGCSTLIDTEAAMMERNYYIQLASRCFSWRPLPGISRNLQPKRQAAQRVTMFPLPNLRLCYRFFAHTAPPPAARRPARHPPGLGPLGHQARPARCRCRSPRKAPLPTSTTVSRNTSPGLPAGITCRAD